MYCVYIYNTIIHHSISHQTILQQICRQAASKLKMDLGQLRQPTTACGWCTHWDEWTMNIILCFNAILFRRPALGNLRLEQHQKNSHQSCLAWANFAHLHTAQQHGQCMAVWFAMDLLLRFVGAMGWTSDCKRQEAQKLVAKHSRTDCLHLLTTSCKSFVNSYEPKSAEVIDSIDSVGIVFISLFNEESGNTD